MITFKKLEQNHISLLVRGFLFCLICLAFWQSSWWENNWESIQKNRALADPRLSLEDRMAIFETYGLVDEMRAWETAVSHLQQTPNYAHQQPIEQLFVNPSFAHGLSGWTQYNGDWQTEEKVAFIERQGKGHTSLSQSRVLENGCYLFMVSGEIDRLDETPNFWLYLEVFVDGQPQGDTLRRGTEHEFLDNQMEIFCLQDGSQKMTLAPINVYGDASVRLYSTYLFRLGDG